MREAVGARRFRLPIAGAVEAPETEAASAWPPSPPRPSFAPGDIHLFRVGLDVPDHRLQRLHRFLATGERARAERFHDSRDARRYVVGRATLRSVLARYLVCAPVEVVIATEASGRPIVPSACRHGPLFFNVTHAGDLALVAVTGIAPIGVDVEEIHEIAEMERLADRFFSPEESRALRELPGDLRTAAFFRCWTRKEAVLKATGEGLAGDLGRFEVTLDPAPARVVRWDGRSGRSAGWNLRHLAPAPGFVGALALRGPIRSLRMWSWPPDGRVNPPRPASRPEPAGPRRWSMASPESPHAEDAPGAE
ncbi:MAG: 4'-phosphopantetheinyl transferase superfamily protein [Longimicrobiales bacterium]|nr:4'-phosphopantetheinyl transferase superfamily protein [Longimicrobiales bacterium]